MSFKIFLLLLYFNTFAADPVPPKCLQRARRILCQKFFPSDFEYCVSVKTILIYQPDQNCIHFKDDDLTQCLYSKDGCPMSITTNGTQEQKNPVSTNLLDLLKKINSFNTSSMDKATQKNTIEAPTPPMNGPKVNSPVLAEKTSLLWFQVTVGVIKYMATFLIVLVAVIVSIWLFFLSKKKISRSLTSFTLLYNIKQARWRRQTVPSQTAKKTRTPPPSPVSIDRGQFAVHESVIYHLPPRPSIGNLFQCTANPLDEPIVEVVPSTAACKVKTISKPEKLPRTKKHQKQDSLPASLYKESSPKKRDSIFQMCVPHRAAPSPPPSNKFQRDLLEAKLRLRKTFPSPSLKTDLKPVMLQSLDEGRKKKIQHLRRPKLPLSFELRHELTKFKEMRETEKEKQEMEHSTETHKLDQHINGKTKKLTEVATNKPTIGPMEKQTDGQMDTETVGRTDNEKDGQKDNEKDGQMDKMTVGQTDKEKDGQMDKETDEQTDVKRVKEIMRRCESLV